MSVGTKCRWRRRFFDFDQFLAIFQHGVEIEKLFLISCNMTPVTINIFFTPVQLLVNQYVGVHCIHVVKYCFAVVAFGCCVTVIA